MLTGSVEMFTGGTMNFSISENLYAFSILNFKAADFSSGVSWFLIS